MERQTAPGRRRRFNEPRDVSVQLDAGPSAAALARSALIPIERKVDEQLMADLRLLVSELVTNSVRHADLSPSAKVNLEVAVSDRKVHVEVRDSGQGFEPSDHKPDAGTPGGWGLFLVEELADRWGVMRNHFTRVWFEMDLGRRPPAMA